MRISDEDRKILELAAKAEGITGPFIDYCGIGIRAERDGWICWNPLKDDGDALRLAVKLKIDIDNMTDACYCEGEYGHDVFLEIKNDDPYFTTRRAITIVAAKIAKGSTCE